MPDLERSIDSDPAQRTDRFSRWLPWTLLGLFTLVSLGVRAHPGWYALAVAPWGVGALAIARAGRDRRLAERSDEPSSAAHLWILALLCVVLARLFGVDALLFACLYSGAAWLWVGPRRPSGDRFLQNLATLGTALFLILAIIEVVLRATGVSDGGPEPVDMRAGDENAMRFRSVVESVDKPDSTSRILVLGDSFSYGQGVAKRADTWPLRLEARLAADSSLASRWELVNLARPGFTTVNEAEMLRRLGWQFSPDLLILQFHPNDALPSGPDFHSVPSRHVFPEYSLLPARFRNGSVENTATYRFVHGAIRARLNDGYDYTPLFDPGSRTGAEYRAAVGEIASSAAGRGVPVVLVLFPSFRDDDWQLARSPQDLAAELAAGQGMHVLDLRPAFASWPHPPSYWRASRDDAHPSDRAHAVAAGVIAEYLLEQRLVR